MDDLFSTVAEKIFRRIRLNCARLSQLKDRSFSTWEISPQMFHLIFHDLPDSVLDSGFVKGRDNCSFVLRCFTGDVTFHGQNSRRPYDENFHRYRIIRGSEFKVQFMSLQLTSFAPINCCKLTGPRSSSPRTTCSSPIFRAGLKEAK